MKVGIITIYDCNNNGNRLQNYAVQEILRTMGIEAYTICNVPFKDSAYVYDIFFLRSFIKRAIRKINRRKYHLQKIQEYNSAQQKCKKNERAFERFNRLIQFHQEWISEYKLFLNDKTFDAFVVGSDQVWNYHYQRASRIDFLEFAGEKPKIALSASLGGDVLDNSMERRFKRYLSGFVGISVREETAKNILQPLVKQQIKVLLDPTMAIEGLRWKRLSNAAECKIPVTPYVVKLFLGNDGGSIAIESYMSKSGCSVVNLGDSMLPYGPLEFLKFIQNADMVFTDSFHACVFSIIFHTNFYAMKRLGDDESIFTRIENLLKKFNFTDRILDTEIKPIEEERFTAADAIIERERAATYSFLKKALNI